MIPQNPFQGTPVRPVASPVNLGLSAGQQGGQLQRDLTDLSGLSQTALAASQALAQESQRQFKEDFSIGQAEALSHPQLLSDLQVGVEAQKGGDEATKRLRSTLKRLRKEGKITGPESTGFYAGVETSLGIRVGKNKGDALTKFIRDSVGKLDPESDTSPNPKSFDALQAEFESQYEDPTSLPTGYYAADGFANAYAQDIDSARNGYFKAVTEYEQRRGLDNTVQLAADVIVADTLDGQKTHVMIGEQLMNHMKNSVDLGLVPASEQRSVRNQIIELAAQRASVSRGDRQAQLGLDVVEAAKEWKIPETGRTLIEDDPAFFEKLQDDWERRLENDVVAEGQLREKQAQTHVIDWTITMRNNIALAEAEGRSVSQAIEDTREQLKESLGDSAYFGTVDLALIQASDAARDVYDRSTPEALVGWKKELALNPGATINLLAAGPVPNLSEKDRTAMLAEAIQTSGPGGGSGKDGFAASLAQSIAAPANFIPPQADVFSQVNLDLSGITIQAMAQHSQIQRKLSAGLVTFEEAQSEIATVQEEAVTKAKAIVTPIRTEYTKLIDAYHMADAAGELGPGMAALNSLKERGFLEPQQYTAMADRIRSQANFNPLFRTSDWNGFRSLVEDAITGGDKTDLLKVSAANERIAQEEADMKKQALAWRKEGYTPDEIAATLLVPYLTERRNKLLTESGALGHDEEGLRAELLTGGTIQTYVEKSGEAAAFQRTTQEFLLKPLIDGNKVDLAEVQKKLFSPSFTGPELPGILDDLYNGGGVLTPSTVARAQGLRNAIALAGDIAEGTAYSTAKDKDQMMVDLLGVVPGGVHFSFVLEGTLPVFDTKAYELQIQLKSAGSYSGGMAALGASSFFHGTQELGAPQGAEPLYQASLAGVTLNPYRHSMFTSVDEIRKANEDGTLKKLMSALNLPLSREAAALFVDAQTNLLTSGYN